MNRARLAFAALLCLVSGSAWAELRTYDVDPQYSQEIFGALHEVLQGSARVQLLPTGQILVNATPETLDEVEQLLRAIRAHPAGATPRVELRYWVVHGARAAANATPNAQQTVVVNTVPFAAGAPPPAALNGVLTELRRFHGDLTFRVVGTAAVVSESGQHGGVEGVPLRVEQRAHVQGDTLNAQVAVRLVQPVTWDPRPQEVGELEVRTSLKRGEFVVLGESTQQSGGSDGTLFYIVHWPE
jgi:hypothetical protein